PPSAPTPKPVRRPQLSMNVTSNCPHRGMIRPDIDKQPAFGLRAAHQGGLTGALAILAPDAEQQGSQDR
ncbi:MAG: hypothetical protein E6833_33270, partial [Bradyrhizobium sp.]|nr:hypothetical protein [Bradyrhizobium sp.]